ncbi:MAG: hypothetical protein U5P41_03305 [Gammaproteobacteria bacterium]|nr:hypothetical protein [Gammaproteobacteria bacterium]
MAYINNVILNDRIGVDIHHALELRTSGTDGNAGFPDRFATRKIDCQQTARIKAGNDVISMDDRGTGPAQGQGRHRTIIDPLPITGFGIQADQLAVHRAHHDGIVDLPAVQPGLHWGPAVFQRCSPVAWSSAIT